MHKYLRAIGFSKLTKRRDLEKLIQYCAQNATERFYTTKETEDDVMLAVINKEFARGIGFCICGEYEEKNQFFYNYSFPYIKGEGISSCEDITIERQTDKESYAGICDDVKVGVTLIFYLQNMIPYIKAKNSKLLPIKGTTLTLSALSTQGTIMMPILKNENEKQKIRKANVSRSRLIEAARRGDEEAIESLTLEDMDTYTSISKKIHQDDLFTLVDTYFMPYGAECDLYSVMGEIENIELVENELTKEKIYRLTITCNELTFDVCINSLDLYGEPQVGRRFKGIIWLQGMINFPSM